MTTTSDADRLEQIISEFEGASAASDVEACYPRLLDFLPAGGASDLRHRATVELTLIDLEHRLKRGESASLDGYLAQFPTLKEDPSALRELIKTAYRFSLFQGNDLALDDYAARFPSVCDSTLLEDLRTMRSDPANDPAVPRFRVIRFHRRGGLGEVFEAYDRELKRCVALKEIRSDHADEPAYRARLIREAEVTGRLEHPGIVSVYSLGRHDDGRPFYAMRFIRGGIRLTDAIGRWHADQGNPRRSSLQLRNLLGHFIQICNAIAYAHNRGVIHRDIKPDNVLLGPYGETLVVDWGLAKFIEQTHSTTHQEDRELLPRSFAGSGETLPGSSVGTPGFMSPEQAAGQLDRHGTASDIYSLGATLYCVLTGRAPRQDFDPDRIAGTGRHDEFQTPSRLNLAVSPALEAIYLKAMEPRPELRYATPRALAGDIERVLAGEPVSVYRERWSERTRRWARRHRTLVTTFAAVSFIALVGLGVVSLVLNWKNRELAKTNQELLSARADVLKERDQARETTGFFLSSFRKPDPTQDGKEVKVVDAIGRSLKELEAREIAPTTKATILDAVGETYHGLGLVPQTLGVWEQAFAIRRRELGEGHADTLSSMNNLAEAYYEAGDLSRAIDLLDRTLKARRAKLGADHPDTLTSLNDLAECYRATGRFDLAIPLFEQAVNSLRSKLGADHPNTLMAIDNLAVAYRNAGQFDRGLSRHEEVLQAQRSKLGEDHPVTLASMNNLAAACRDAGRLSRAISLYDKALEVQRRKLGEDHPDTLSTRQNLGTAYRDIGRLDDAVPLLEQTALARRNKLGANHPDTLTTRRNLAEAYEKVGRSQDAEALFRETIAAVRERKPRNDRFYSDSLALLGRCLIRQKKCPEALPFLRECLEIKEAVQPDDWTTANARSLLGEALSGCHAFAEAEPLLLAAQKRLSELREKIMPLRRDQSLGDAALRLARLYEAWGNPARAEHWKKMADAQRP
jgi:serine/threonine protein kinase